MVLWILISLTMLLCLTVAVCYIIVEVYAYPRVFNQVDNLPEKEFGLVLGTSPVLKDGRPNRYFLRRISATVQLYQAGKIHRIILSGDKHEGYDEPTSMQIALVAAGVPAEVCLLDGKGYDTVDSIRNARKLFGAESFTIISQDFHCERAVLLAGCLGIRAIAFEAEDVESFWQSRTKHREILARVKVFKDVLMLKLRNHA